VIATTIDEEGDGQFLLNVIFIINGTEEVSPTKLEPAKQSQSQRLRVLLE
jgi:hypothetical protein